MFSIELDESDYELITDVLAAARPMLRLSMQQWRQLGRIGDRMANARNAAQAQPVLPLLGGDEE